MLQKKDIETLRMLFSSHNYIMTTAELTASKLYLSLIHISIRKHRGMKQQELADKIGINMQSLSKIERSVNFPTFDTLEKIIDVLGVTPNELLSGEWKFVNQGEKEVCQFLKIEERLNAELKHGHYDNFFDSEEEWLEYELEKLRE